MSFLELDAVCFCVLMKSSVNISPDVSFWVTQKNESHRGLCDEVVNRPLIYTRAARYFACDSHVHLVSKDGLAVNLHHLFSNGAAFNTQSRSSRQATQFTLR